MKLTKKLFNKILFAVVVALVFAFINRCTVKAYNINYDTGAPYFYTNGTVDSSNSFYFDMRDYVIGTWDYGCDNTFNNFEVLDTFELNGGTCTYVLQSTQNPTTYLVGSNPMSSLGNVREPFTPVFMAFVVPDSYDFAVMRASGYSAYITVLLFPSGDNPTLSYTVADGINFTSINNSTFVYNLRISNATQYNVASFAFTKVNIVNTKYLSSGFFSGPISLYTNGLNYMNQPSLYYYYANNSITWNTSNGDEEFPDTSPIFPIDYDIDFVTINSSDNSQEDYGNDLTITSEAIAIKYIPCDNELYDYYYEFVPQGGQSTGNFEQVNDNKCIGTYIAKENGYLMAKITDKQGNYLLGVTYHVLNVGTLSTFAVNNNKFSTFLTDISSNINYGGPISGLTTIPINLMSTLYNSFNGTCSPYNLGTIFGHNIVINCFTLQSILGSSITGVIDMICAFGIYYHLVLLIISIYRRVMNLQELNDYLGNNEEYDLHE